MGYWWNNTYRYWCWIHLSTDFSPIICCIYINRHRSGSCNNFHNFKYKKLKSSTNIYKKIRGVIEVTPLLSYFYAILLISVFACVLDRRW